MSIQPFHLAFPTHDLDASRRFYLDLLGCKEGRSSPHWVDFDFYGHQIVAHLAPNECSMAKTSEVDGDNVPCRHFGVVLTMKQWHELADKLKAAKTEFIIEPHIRFKGEPGEQATMFFLDPSGNAVEFKAFERMENLFAK
jgi:uncharacterized protein